MNGGGGARSYIGVCGGGGAQCINGVIGGIGVAAERGVVSMSDSEEWGRELRLIRFTSRSRPGLLGD